MNSVLKKALSKKNKFLNKKEYNTHEEEALTSEDEEEIEKNYIGKILVNRYLVLAYIGRGTFCRIMLVWDSVTDKYRAAKFFSETSSQESNNEIKMNKKINKCPYVVCLFDSFTLNDYSVLVYELLGVSLFKILCDLECSRYSIEKDICNKIIKDCLIGLNDLHKQNIVHLDIKPENILTNILPEKIQTIVLEFKKQQPKKLFDDSQTNLFIENKERLETTNLYKKKMIKKKLKYRSFRLLDIPKANPEMDNMGYDYNLIKSGDFKTKIIDLGNSEIEENLQFDNQPQYLNCYRPIFDKYYTCKSDIWALGCIYYELLTGGDYLCEENPYLIFKYFGVPFQSNLENIYEPGSLEKKIGTNKLKYFFIFDKHMRLNCEHLLKIIN